MLFYAELLPNGEKRALAFAVNVVDGATRVVSFKLGDVLPKGLKLIPFGHIDINGEGEGAWWFNNPAKTRKNLRHKLLSDVGIYSSPEIKGCAVLDRIHYQARCSEAFERRTPLETDLNGRNTIISSGIITYMDIPLEILVKMDTNILSAVRAEQIQALQGSDEQLRKLTPPHLIPVAWLNLLKNPTTEDDIFNALLSVANETNAKGAFTVPGWWNGQGKDGQTGQLQRRKDQGDFFARLLIFAKTVFAPAAAKADLSLSTDRAASAADGKGEERKEALEAAAVNSEAIKVVVQQIQPQTAGAALPAATSAAGDKTTDGAPIVTAYLHEQQQQQQVQQAQLQASAAQLTSAAAVASAAPK